MNTASRDTPAISSRSLLQYGFIALPVAFAGFPLYVLAPDFYAVNHGISLTVLGTLLLFIRLFDAVQDPLIGWFTDKLQGRFLPFIGVAAVVLCVSILGLFNVVVFNPAVWFSVCMVLAVSSYSVLAIVLGAQATLWTADRYDQTRIASAREAFGLIGLVIAVSLPTILSQVVQREHIYIWYGAILGVLMAVGVAIFSSLPKLATSRLKSSRPLLAGLRALSRESYRFFAIYGLSMLASSVPAVLVIFYVRDLLASEHLTGLFLLLYFLSGVAAMPVWKQVSARLGKYNAWCISNLLAVTGFIGAFFLGPADIWAYGVVCVITGLALGADLTMPASILADQIHARGNSAFAGTFYALLALVAKASLAIASATALPILDAAGFKPRALNSEDALMALSLAYALIPCVLKLVAAGLLYGFFIRSHSGGNHANSQDHGNDRNPLYV